MTPPPKTHQTRRTPLDIRVMKMKWSVKAPL